MVAQATTQAQTQTIEHEGGPLAATPEAKQLAKACRSTILRYAASHYMEKDHVATGDTYRVWVDKLGEDGVLLAADGVVALDIAFEIASAQAYAVFCSKVRERDAKHYSVTYAFAFERTTRRAMAPADVLPDDLAATLPAYLRALDLALDAAKKE